MSYSEEINYNLPPDEPTEEEIENEWDKKEFDPTDEEIEIGWSEKNIDPTEEESEEEVLRRFDRLYFRE